jgi:hypothetical protein
VNGVQLVAYVVIGLFVILRLAMIGVFVTLVVAFVRILREPPYVAVDTESPSVGP